MVNSQEPPTSFLPDDESGESPWESEEERSISQPPRRERWMPFIFGGTALFVVMVAGSVGWCLHGSAPSAQQPPSPAILNQGSTFDNSYQIKVDVQGDVLRPGVVSVSSTARVEDVVRAAGGYRHKTDSSQVNEAALVTDGEEVFIPGVPVQAGAVVHHPTSASMLNPPSSPSKNSGTMLSRSSSIVATINLNSATAASLETLPDIGPSRALAILTYRQANGSFQSVAELRHVHGIGPTIYGRISPYVYVGGQGR